MAKKPTRERPKDQHASGFMVRLPEGYRAALDELKKRTDRPYTASVRRALDAYLREQGIEPPETV